MDARLWRVAYIAALIVTLPSAVQAASYRTANFLVTAATPDLAREVGDAAETFRRELALSWLERELPDWQDKCPITVHAAPNLGAGGVTQFYFDRGRPHGWTMSVQGTRERILDSVLPHEVLHTVFATHFGRPLPRWADEGACTTVEDISERSKQERLLFRFLTTNRGIAFNQMFAMTEYPSDVLPLYSQGYALARFLIAVGGRPRFVRYVGEGMKTNNWADATRRNYGVNDLSELQVKWLEWVRVGADDRNAQTYLTSVPDQSTNNAIAATPISVLPVSATTPASNESANNHPQARVEALVTVPDTVVESLASQPTSSEQIRLPARESTDGWYIKRRDEHRAAHPEIAAERKQQPESKPIVTSDRRTSTQVSRPQPMMQVQPTVIEWSRSPSGRLRR